MFTYVYKKLVSITIQINNNIIIIIAVDCGELRSPSNGVVDYEDTVFQSVATYSCNKGFEISGEETRICNEDGSWLGSMPSCKRKSLKLYSIELTVV